ncbi:MAG: ergothioneine biosynthesis protein EgtB [Rhizonema sp. NSF051]|nr:ergothioneine biosynthesis protein EgtB [Rhizonema sp. NSF051]
MNYQNSLLNKSSLNEAIALAFQQRRATTLALFEGIEETTFCRQVHPDFSPVGWHLGHIAYTESLWLLERSAGLRCLFPQYHKLFAADGLPKNQRVQLPTLEEIRYYLSVVREEVLNYLKVADVESEERLLRFLLQHESQHNEIITFVLELLRTQESEVRNQESADKSQELLFPPSLRSEMIQIPAGEFEIGNNSIDALDNEQPMHRIYLEAYWIDRYPVTCGQYRAFIEAGGYQNSCWWLPSGWEWLQTESVIQPLYWCYDPAWHNHPVCGVSWYEAEAYSRYVGKRLPTEAEWEKAVSWDAKANRRRIYPWGDEKPTPKHCNFSIPHQDLASPQIGKTTSVDAYPAGQSAYGLYDALGNVWEWTASWFDRYSGFQSYPYVGYSQVYFDQQHRVLKGGSWATCPWSLRSSFRNWYHPTVRQLFAGFRCASNRSL